MFFPIFCGLQERWNKNINKYRASVLKDTWIYKVPHLDTDLNVHKGSEKQ